jgi:hypothetical protein
MKEKRSSRKCRNKKSEYMSDEAFAKLKQALEDALAFERWERRDLSVMRIQGPGDHKVCDLPKAKPSQ